MFLSFLTIIESADLDCNYDNLNYPPFGSFYCCKIQNNLNITSRFLSTIGSAKGTHNAGKSNDDVMSITADRKNIQYFPNGMEKFFKNINAITILYCRLKKLTQEDLMLFMELLILNLMGNDIEVLEEDVFAFNNNLSQIYLNDNKLIKIDENAFKNLDTLTHLNLKNNLCIDKQAINNPTGVKEVIEEAQNQCNAEDYSNVEKILRHYEDNLICTNSETIPIVDKRLKEIRDVIEGSKLSKSPLFKEKLEIMSSWKENNIWSVKNKTDSFEVFLMNHSNEIISKIETGDEKLKNSLKNIEFFLEQVKDEICVNISSLEINLTNKIDNIQEVMNFTAEDQTTLINNLEELILVTEETIKKQMANDLIELKALDDKITNLEELISHSTGQATNRSQNTEKDLNKKINNLDRALKESEKKIEGQMATDMNGLMEKITSDNKALDAKISNIETNLNNKIAASEKSLTDKIDNIERILRSYISADTKTISNFQSRVDDRLKVQNYKIDNNSEIQGSTQSVLVASCAFLVSIIIYIAYKKFLFRVMEVEEERNGIY